MTIFIWPAIIVYIFYLLKFDFISFLCVLQVHFIKFFLGKLTGGMNPQLRKLNQKADNWKIER